MFEGLAAYFLNKYLHRFIEGVKAHDLQTAAFSGKLKLQNVKLKTEALDFLQLPIDVISGAVGNVMIQMSWKLQSEPVKVILEDLYLVARPRSDIRCDVKAALEVAITSKLRKLADWQSIRLAAPSSKKNKDAGLYEKLAFAVMKNLKISIRNIHFRFEGYSPGSESKNGTPAVGLCLRELSVCTTNKEGNETFVTDTNAKIFYKKMKFEGLSAYLNTRSRVVNDARHLKSYFSSQPEYFKHILNPVSGEAILYINDDPPLDSRLPHYHLSCNVDKIDISLARRQYVCFLQLLLSLSNAQSRMSDSQSKVSFCEGSSEEREEYTRLYKRTLNAMWLDALDEKGEARLSEIERKLTFSSLAKCRAQAIAQLRHQLKEGETVMIRQAALKLEQEKQSTSWIGSISSLWGGGREGAGGSRENLNPKISERDVQELYDEIRFDPEEELKIEAKKRELPKDYPYVVVQFKLKEFVLRMLSKSWETELTACASDVDMTTHLNMGQTVVQGRLTGLFVRDMFTPDTAFKNIVYHDDTKGGEVTHLLEFHGEFPPIDSPADLKLRLTLQKVFVIVNSVLLSHISNFFASPAKTQRSVALVSEWTLNQAQRAFDASTTVVQQSLENYKQIDVFLSLDAPTIMFPSSMTSRGADMLVVETGSFKLSTSLGEREKMQQVLEQILRDNLHAPINLRLLGKDGQHQQCWEGKKLSLDDYNRCYDSYSITGSNFEAFIIKAEENWRQKRRADLEMEAKSKEMMRFRKGPNVVSFSPSNLLAPFDLSLTFSRSMVLGASIPTIRVKGEVSKITFGVDQQKMKKLDRILRVFREGLDTRTNLPAKRVRSTAKNYTNENPRGISKYSDGELRDNILDEKSNQTYAELQHALGHLVDVDREAQALLQEAKGTRGGIPAEKIRDWWAGRLKRLERTVDFHVDLRMGSLSVLVGSSSGSHEPSIARVMCTIRDMECAMAFLPFQNWSKVTIAAIDVDDFDCKSPSPTLITTRVEEKGESHNSGIENNFVVLEHNSFMSDAPIFPESAAPVVTDIRLGRILVDFEPHRIEGTKEFLVKSLLGEDGFHGLSSPSSKGFGESLKTMVLKTSTLSNILQDHDEEDCYYLLQRGLKINLRSEPSTDKSLKTGLLIEPGSVFKAAKRVKRNGHIFLKIVEGDQEGWVFTSHPKDGSPLIIPFAEAKVKRRHRVESRMSARIDELGFLLRWKDQSVAHMRMQGAALDVKNYEFSQDVDISLAGINVVDQTPKGRVHRNMISTRKSESAVGLLKLTYSTFDPHEVEYPGFSSGLYGSFKGMEIVYTKRFNDEIQTYFTREPFTRLLSSSNVQPPTRSHSKPNIDRKHLTKMENKISGRSDKKHSVDTTLCTDPKPDFLDIKLELTGIHLVLPENSISHKGVSAELGSVLVTSKISRRTLEIKASSPEAVAKRADFFKFVRDRNFLRYQIDVSTFSILSHNGSRAQHHGAHLLDVTRLKVIYDSWECPSVSLGGCWISVDGIEGTLTKMQYSSILSISMGNLCEERCVVMNTAEVHAPPFVNDAKEEKNSTTAMDTDAMPLKAASPSTSILYFIGINIPRASFMLNDASEFSPQSSKDNLLKLRVCSIYNYVRYLTSGSDGKSAFTSEFSCTGASLTNISDSVTDDRRIHKPFREILLVQPETSSEDEAPLQFSLIQNGGVNLGSLNLETLPMGQTEYDCDMLVSNLRFIFLERCLLRLISFFELPCTLIMDGWAGKSNAPLFQMLQRYLALKHVNEGSIRETYVLTSSLDTGGVAIHTIDLADVSVVPEASQDILIKHRSHDKEGLLCTLHLRSHAERSRWLSALTKFSAIAADLKRRLDLTRARDADASLITSSSLRFQCQFVKAQAIVLRKPYEYSTDGITLAGGLNVRYESKSRPIESAVCSVSVKSAELCHIWVDGEEKGQDGERKGLGVVINQKPIVQKFTVNMDLQQFQAMLFGHGNSERPEAVVDKSYCKITVTPIYIDLRFSEISMIMDVIKNIRESLTGDSSVEMKEVKGDIMSLAEDEAKGKIASEEQNAQVENRNIVPTKESSFDWNFEMESKELRLTLVNDLSNLQIPVCRLMVQNSHMETKKFSHSTSLGLSVNISLDFNDVERQQWRHLIPLFGATLSVRSIVHPTVEPQDMLQSIKQFMQNRNALTAKTHHSMSVTTGSTVDLHLTQGLLRSMREHTRIFNENREGKREELGLIGIDEEKTSDAQTISNETEIPIVIESADQKKSGKRIIVGPFSSVKLTDSTRRARIRPLIVREMGGGNKPLPRPLEIYLQCHTGQMLQNRNHNNAVANDRNLGDWERMRAAMLPNGRFILVSQRDNRHLQCSKTGVCRFDNSRNYFTWDQWIVEVRNGYHYFVSAQSRKVLQVTKNRGVVRCENHNRMEWESIRVYMTPREVSLITYRIVYLKGRDGLVVQNAGRGVARAANENLDEWEAIKIERAADVVGFYMIKSLKDNTYLYCLQNGACTFQPKTERGKFVPLSHWLIEERDGFFFFLSRSSRNTLQITPNGIVRCDGKNRGDWERFQVVMRVDNLPLDIKSGGGGGSRVRYLPSTSDDAKLLPAVFSVDLDKVSTSVLKLDGVDLGLRCSVEVLKGKKSMRFHSKWLVTNAMSCAVEIRLLSQGMPISSGQDDDDCGVWKTVPAKTSVHLPTLIGSGLGSRMQGVEMYFRPAGGEYRWSRMSVCPKPQKTNVIVHSEGKIPWFTIVQYVENSDERMDEVKLFPAMCIKNSLPDLVDVRCLRKNVGLREISLHPGASANVTCLSTEEAFAIRIRMPSVGERFSHQLEFGALRPCSENTEISEQRHIVLVDPLGKELKVTATVDMINSTIFVTFSVDLWIFDTTGLNLILSENKSKLLPRRGKNMNTFKHVSNAEKIDIESGARIASAEMFSFQRPHSKKQRRRIYIRAQPSVNRKQHSLSIGTCPSSVLRWNKAAKNALGFMLSCLKDNSLGAKEDPIYYFRVRTAGRGGSRKTKISIILTESSVLVFSSASMKKRIRLADILHTQHQSSTKSGSSRIEFINKNGSREEIEFWDHAAAKFYNLVILQILNLSFRSNIEGGEAVASMWSDQAISADVEGEQGVITIPAERKSVGSKFVPCYSIGHSVTKGDETWGMTNIVSLFPAVTIVNNAHSDIQLMQHGTDLKTDAFQIPAEFSCAFHWPSIENERALRFRCIERDGELSSLESERKVCRWSGFFRIDKPTEFILELYDKKSKLTTFAKIEVRCRTPRIFVFISIVGTSGSEIPITLPYRVENRCMRESFFVQQHVPKMDARCMCVPPLRNVQFALTDVFTHPKEPKIVIRLDDANSDSTAEHFLLLTLTSGTEMRRMTLRLQPKWSGLKPYDVHVFVNIMGPVKVICISEDAPDVQPISPFGVAPLQIREMRVLERQLHHLKTSIVVLREQMRKIKSKLGHEESAQGATHSSILDKYSTVERMHQQRARLFHLFRPKLMTSRRFYDLAICEKKRLEDLGMESKLAATAGNSYISMSTVSVFCKVRGVRGALLNDYDLLGPEALNRLVCVVVIEATMQSVCFDLCRDGKINVEDVDFSFRIPKAFLYDERKRMTIQARLRVPWSHGCGWNSHIIASASVNLRMGGDVRVTKWHSLLRGADGQSNLDVQLVQEVRDVPNTHWGKKISLHLPRVGVLLTENVAMGEEMELLHLSVHGICAVHTDSIEQETLKIDVARVQIDNQRLDALYPVIVHRSKTSSKHILQVSLNRSKMDFGVSKYTIPTSHNRPLGRRMHHFDPEGDDSLEEVVNPQAGCLHRRLRWNSMVFSYVSVLLQACDVRLEFDFLKRLGSVYEEFRLLSRTIVLTLRDDDMEKQCGLIPKSYVRFCDVHIIPSADESSIVIAFLELHSILLSLSFQCNSSTRGRGVYALMNLASITDSKIMFDHVKMHNVNLSSNTLVDKVSQKYIDDIRRQCMRIIFGADLFGNPVGLLTGMAEGVESFFKDPIEGVVEDPSLIGFAKGVRRGTKTLLGKTVVSTVGAAGKVTGTLGKGLAMLSMDDDFIRATNNANERAKKGHIGVGLLSGAEVVGRGILGGVKGLVADPLKGAKKGGVKGFFKGVGKGLLGVFAKPTAGIATCASGTLSSLENTANKVLKMKRKGEAPERVRPPRR